MMQMQKKIFNIICGKYKKKYNFHFVGIGGVSMNSLAMYILNLGQGVSGSDTKKTANTKKLALRGAKIFYGHSENNIRNCDYVIYSFAVKDNVEVKKAKDLKIPVLSRAEFLSLILKKYKTSICVAGAHGKTTTTALIYSVLKEAGLNPSLHLGGTLLSENIFYTYTNSDYIVCEACEYNDAFLKLNPKIAVVLNTAPEHLDYFKTYENVKKSFIKFGNKANVLFCANEHNYIKNNNKAIYLGKNGDFKARNIKILQNGGYVFDVYKHKKYFGRFMLNVLGEYNIYNALFAVAIGDLFGINKKIIRVALKRFAGVYRRMEKISLSPLIYCDYAHHPDEINACLKEMDKYYKNKLFIIFQPHTYSRTKSLMDKFIKCFKGRDVVIYKTFSAREKYNKQGSAKKLAQEIGENATFCKSINKLIEIIKQKSKQGYTTIILGEGDLEEKIRLKFKRLN